MKFKVLFSNWTKLFQKIKNNFGLSNSPFFYFKPNGDQSDGGVTILYFIINSTLFFKYKTKRKPYQCRLYVSIANVTLFLFGFEERFEQNWFHFGQVSSTTILSIFFFKQLSFLHSTLNFLVRYWSRFSKVFRKFFRSIVYISNQKDQSFSKVFWKVFFDQSFTFLTKKTKVFGKFLESFWKVFWKVFGKFLESFWKVFGKFSQKYQLPQLP